jgi:hypothetical protein
MIKLSLKHWSLIATCIFGGAILVTKISNAYIEKRPEIELCRGFLNKQENFFSAYVGSVRSVVYEKQDAGRVSFKGEELWGFYCFDVFGDAGEIRIRVYWKNTKQNDDFRVVRIEQVRGSDSPLQIWP